MASICTEPVPYELRIGVTGHRTLADEAAVAQGVARLLDHLDRTLSSQGCLPLQWVAISPLAKGADRVVARAVLARPGARLEVMTPFELDEYRRDFDQPKDLAEFEELLARAASITQLHAIESAPTDADRRRGYYDVGQAVVDACEVLIAIWDGKPSAGRGGTAEIVEYAVTRGHMVLWIRADASFQAPARLVPPARGHASDPSAFYATAALPQKASQLSIGYAQMAELACDPSISPAACAAACRQAVDRLSGMALAAGVPRSHIEPILQGLAPHAIRAGKLAAHYQRLHVRVSKSIFYLSSAAVTIVAFHVLCLPEQRWMVAAELAMMAAAVLFLIAGRVRAYDEKWVRCRFLAEHLRTAMFTLLVGDDPRARMQRARRALPFYPGPEGWVTDTVGWIVARVREALPPPGELAPVKQFIVRSWLAAQRDWHHDTAWRKQRLHRRSRATVVALFVATLGAACAHLAGLGHGQHGHPIQSPGVWATLLAIVLPAWGASVHAVSKQLDYERIAARSEHMSRALGLIVPKAERAATLEDLRAVVHEAAWLMSLEVTEWRILGQFNRPALVA